MIRKLVACVTLPLIAALSGSCAEPPPRPGVVLMVAEQLGAWEPGCGGDPSARTPTLDALARRGLQFSTCVGQSYDSMSGLATLLTGRFASGHGAPGSDFEVAPGVPMMAEGIRAKSYRTAAFLDGDLPQDGNGLERGFDRFDTEFVRRSLAFYSLPDSALAWINAEKRPSFVVVMVGSGAESVDANARHMIRGLEDAGLADRTFLLFTSLDGRAPRGSTPEIHGFGWELDVPLWITAPAWIAPALRADPAMHVDVFPTVLQCLGFAPARLPGRGLLRVPEDDGERPLVAESWPGGGWVRSVQLGTWRAVHDEAEDEWFLYDLTAADPMRDVAAERPQVLERLKTAMPEPGYFHDHPPSPRWR